jgi:UDP-N-acetylmuramyl pentapeptide phosphotransferase/UDP-N-acetylglucosamine-1-phosphate transferase
MLSLGAVGFADNYLKVTPKQSPGITGRLKLLFQTILAAIPPAATPLRFPTSDGGR